MSEMLGDTTEADRRDKEVKTSMIFMAPTLAHYLNCETVQRTVFHSIPRYPDNTYSVQLVEHVDVVHMQSAFIYEVPCHIMARLFIKSRAHSLVCAWLSCSHQSRTAI